MQAAPATGMRALPPEAYRIPCQPTVSGDIREENMVPYSETAIPRPFTDPRLSAAACDPAGAKTAPGRQWNAGEVIYELGGIHDTMKDIKNLMETLVSRLPVT